MILVCTSAFFLVPTLLALRRKAYDISTACGILTATSLGYHSTQHPVAHAIDLTYVHGISAAYMSQAIKHAIQFNNPISAAAVTMGICSGIIYYKESCGKTNKIAHAIVHGTAQGAWVLYTLARTGFKLKNHLRLP